MNVRIHKGTPRGRVFAPASKSMAHRLLICAALAEGESIIKGVSDCDDVSATATCLSALGAKVIQDGDTVSVIGTDIYLLPIYMFGRADCLHCEHQLHELCHGHDTLSHQGNQHTQDFWRKVSHVAPEDGRRNVSVRSLGLSAFALYPMGGGTKWIYG